MSSEDVSASSAPDWSVSEAAAVYRIPDWGNGYFSAGEEGHVHVHPDRDPTRSIDLKVLVERLEQRNVDLPVLVRFNGILRTRMQEIHDAFAKAITESDYRGRYRGVFPVKVNQERHVLEKVLEYGRPLGFGLEAGSKPELLAVLALAEDDTLVVCNGFKDEEFLRLALTTQQLGREVIPIVEKFSELTMILRIAEELDIRPRFGIRVKLATRGAGRWQSSGGYRSKFGLTVAEVMEGVALLAERDRLDGFRLLHFHLGSQITNIRRLKDAVIEVARIYADLHRRGCGIEYLDVGGGLGVDYDGSRTDFESSMNYTLEEYAADVVHHVSTVCDEVEVPHPHIITESGRAIAAYHSVLLFETVGTSPQGNVTNLPQSIPEEYEQPLHDLFEAHAGLVGSDPDTSRLREHYHDAQQALDLAMNLFTAGYLPLDQRVVAENLYFAICHRVRDLSRHAEHVPEELAGLDRTLSESYFCNFSLFQSMPDSWAIRQLFPILPVHRLDERPTKHGVLCDVTCDSDGKIDTFVDLDDTKPTLPLHTYDGKPYVLGAFLVGAYQEILGDLHNLFGDTNAVHVDMRDDGQLVVETVMRGDTVRDVLASVHFDASELVGRLQRSVDRSVRRGVIGDAEAGRLMQLYEQGMEGYTYLEGRLDN